MAINLLRTPNGGGRQRAAAHPAPASVALMRLRLGRLKWLVPAGMILIVLVFEAGPAQWLHARFGAGFHYAADAILFGTIGPLLAYAALELLERWLDERETSDHQAEVLADAQKHVEFSRQLNDTALQNLFSASLLLESLEMTHCDLPSNVADQLHQADTLLAGAIQQLRAYLLTGQVPAGAPPEVTAERAAGVGREGVLN